MTQSEASQLVGSEQLAPLLEAAAASTRKRSHLLLHADQQDQVQRLLIALEPESYVRPHVHREQWEMIVLLRGRFDFLIFDPQAELVQRLAMSVASPVVQIPRGTWHSGVALAPETLVLEIKPGPYRPNEFAPWAPEEGEPASSAFVHWAAGARVGSKWRSQSRDLARDASPRLHCLPGPSLGATALQRRIDSNPARTAKRRRFRAERARPKRRYVPDRPGALR